MASAFLTARWTNLVLVTYPVEPARLEGYVPPGCELDLREGRAFVSLVAFDFLDTRVLGVRWPMHVDFPEVNLRTYVHHGGARGVAFVKELVPSLVIPLVARALYNEPYTTATMESEVRPAGDGGVRVAHAFRCGGARHALEAEGKGPPRVPPESSDEHFFKEHDHGFGTDRRGRRVEYRVYHPVWRTYDVVSHRVAVDFGAAYGERWAFLGDVAPCSVVIAEGSGVSVHAGVRGRAHESP